VKFGFDMVAEEYVSCSDRLGTVTPYFSVALKETLYAYGPRGYSEAEVILASRGKVRPSTFTERHRVDESLSEWELARLHSKTWSMEQD